MQKPALPPNEIDRLQALCALDVLDTPSEARFDRITRIAQSHFGVSIALVSLVDAERQWFKSKQGLETCETARDISFCGHAILSAEIFYLSDASKDPRFANNPLVTGAPHIRFYAGAPLRVASGQRVGTLCIIDSRPRSLSVVDRQVLRDLADCVEAELDRTHLLAAAQESARLAMVVERTDNAVLVTDAQGLIQWVNPCFERSTGYTLAEVRGTRPEAVLQCPETAASTIADIRAKIDAGEDYKAELLNHHKNGQGYWLALSIQPVRNAQGELTHFIVIESDITERKTMEMELRSSENRVRAIIETVVDGIVTIDDQGFIHTFNPAAERIFGYTAVQIIGRKINVLMPDPYQREHDGYLHNYLTTGVRKIIGKGREVTGRRRDGSTFPMELAVSEMSINGARKFIGSVRDISQRKQADQELQAVMSMRKAILDSANFSIISTDPDGLILTFNRGAERLLGYGADELVGKQSPAILHDPEEVEARARTLSTELGKTIEPGFETFVAKARLGVPDECEWTYINKNGKRFPVLLSVTAMQDAQGSISGFLGIASDISERKKIERMKSEFISTVSHELRTPLTSIRGALGLILGMASAGLSDQVRMLLDTANRNSERLTLLINDILDLEKIESGRLEFNFKPLDLVALAEQALAAIEGYAQQHQVRLRIAESPAPAHVLGDEHRLLQVFANLLSNAIKYSPPEGEVEVSIALRDTNYRVSVRDRGRGIPQEFRGRIFQRFAQADSSDTREKGGTGLGLSITKAIVERHGGTVDYTSEEGAGSEFFFDLPVWQEAVMQPHAVDGRPLLLICEDNSDVAMVLVKLLAGEGLACDIAASAATAKLLLTKKTYRALLLDLSLPDMDGLTLINELREDKATRQLPIVVVSGRAEEGRASWKGDALAVVDWLQKPVDQARLTRAVRQALTRTARPHILHVEDDPDIIQITQALVEPVGEYSYATTLAAARALLATREFDLVLLDLALPDGSGLELLEVLHGRVPVVVFSGQEADAALSQRVAAALTKSRTSNEELLATIHRVINPVNAGIT